MLALLVCDFQPDWINQVFYVTGKAPALRIEADDLSDFHGMCSDPRARYLCPSDGTRHLTWALSAPSYPSLRHQM